MVTILVYKMSLSLEIDRPKIVVKRAIVQETCWVILLISQNKIHQGALYTLETEQERLSKDRKMNPTTFLTIKYNINGNN